MKLLVMRALILLIVFLASACSPLLQRGEPAAIWQLPSTTMATAPATDHVDWHLRVASPRAVGLLEGSRIVVLPEPGRLSVYKGARWSQATPELWRERLIDAFRQNGSVAAVSSDDDNLHSNLVLGGSLDAFQIEYRDGEPTAVIHYQAQLIDPASRRIIAHHNFTATQAATGTDIPAVVAVLGELADHVSADVVAWTLVEGRQFEAAE